jgi:hypothetical protein
MRASRLFSVAIAGLLTGCSAVANESITFKAKDKSQQVMMRDGESVLTSQGRNSFVTLKPASRQVGKRPIFLVSLENRSKTPLDFRVAEVAATEYRDGVPATDLKIFSYQELVSEEKQLQVSRAVATGLVAGVNSGLAGNNYYARARADQQKWRRKWPRRVSRI